MVEVAREFGTPAYIYDPDDIRAQARAYEAAFAARIGDFEIVYASKAAPITAICSLVREEGLSIDVASGGELHIGAARRIRTRRASTCTATTRPRPSCGSRSRQGSAT